MAVKARMLLVGALPGCRAAETNVGVAHVCHAADSDVEGFANKAVSHQWQLVKMPTAPLIRLELTILDALASQVRRTCTS